MPPESRAPAHVGVVVIHGVGEAQPGWINDHLIPHLESAMPAFAPRGHSEVHPLAAPADGTPADGTGGTRGANDARTTAYMRRAELGPDSLITFAELYWADQSRIQGRSWLHAISAMRLLLEAPDVLAREFLGDTRTFPQRVLRRLILFTGDLLRGPIAGLSLSIFFCAFGLMGVVGLGGFLKTLGEQDYVARWFRHLENDLDNALFRLLGRMPTSFADIDVPAVLIPVLLGLMGASVLMFRASYRRNIVLTELAVSTLFSALALIGILALVLAGVVEVNQATPHAYFKYGRLLVLALWIAWCAATVAAVVLLCLLWLGHHAARLLGGDPERKRPITRAGAALGLVLFQAIIWKVIVSPFAILTNATLAAVSGPASSALSSSELASDSSIGVLWFALFEVFLIGLAVLALQLWRSLRVRSATRRRKLAACDAPRLLLHPLILAAAYLSVLLHICVFYSEISHRLAIELGWSAVFGTEGWFKVLGEYGYRGALGPALMSITIAILPVALVLMLTAHQLQTSPVDILHIVRDIVDYQYRPHSRWARWLATEEQKQALALRDRLEQRLDALTRTLVARHAPARLDKLIFLTHSQGTVIMFDWLRAARQRAALDGVGEIHVITLGSPLNHLYGHYFAEYQHAGLARAPLHDRLASWTNFFRIDDPIASRLEGLGGGIVRDQALPRGGHTRYWEADEVRKLVLALCGRDAPAAVHGRIGPAAN